MSHITDSIGFAAYAGAEGRSACGGGWTIRMESTLKTGRYERWGRENAGLHGYDDWIEVQYLPIFKQVVFIRYRPKRYECPFCDKHPTSQQEVRWYRSHSPYTKAREDRLLKAMIHSTVSDVSLKEGVHL